jgi:hypothetical protein
VESLSSVSLSSSWCVHQEQFEFVPYSSRPTRC